MSDCLRRRRVIWWPVAVVREAARRIEKKNKRFIFFNFRNQLYYKSGTI